MAVNQTLAREPKAVLRKLAAPPGDPILPCRNPNRSYRSSHLAETGPIRRAERNLAAAPDSQVSHSPPCDDEKGPGKPQVILR